MSFYQISKSRLQALNKGVAFVGVLTLIPMMLLTSCEVISRAVFNKPIPGTMELSSYMLALFVLLGIAYTHQVKGHVRVNMLVSHLPPRAAAALDILTTALSMFVMALLAWQGWVVGLEETAVSDMLRIPQMPFKMLVSLAGGLLFMELCFDLIDDFIKMAGRA